MVLHSLTNKACCGTTQRSPTRLVVVLHSLTNKPCCATTQRSLTRLVVLLQSLTDVLVVCSEGLGVRDVLLGHNQQVVFGCWLDVREHNVVLVLGTRTSLVCPTHDTLVNIRSIPSQTLSLINEIFSPQVNYTQPARSSMSPPTRL